MVALATVWVVALPFFWAYNLHKRIDAMSYPETLSLYIPELAAGAVFLVCLPMIFLRPRFAVLGLPFAAFLMVVLKFTVGSPTNVWPASVPFLLFLSWRLHALTARQSRSQDEAARNPG